LALTASPTTVRAIRSDCSSGANLANASSSSPWSNEVPAILAISGMRFARDASCATLRLLRPVFWPSAKDADFAFFALFPSPT
jgi:hypothetical protein